MMNRWFTRYLYGVKNGVEKDPEGHGSCARAPSRGTDPTPYADYPNPDASPVTLLPPPEVALPRSATSGHVGAARGRQGKETLVDDVSVSRCQAGAGHALESPAALRDARSSSAPVHLSGTARHRRSELASSKPAANLSVWVVSLPWTEKGKTNENLITRGWADPQNHSSLRESKPLVPGDFYELSFDLQPDDQIIPAGQQLGLMIFSSDRDFTLWPPAGTKLTIDLEATSLELPVVGGSQALSRALGSATR